MSDVRRQELYCHACGMYVQFDVDLELDGNHVLDCPNCGHEHCRVVKAGIITGERWDQRNGPTHYIVHATTTATSTYTIYTDASTSSDVFLYEAWMNCSGTQ